MEVAQYVRGSKHLNLPAEWRAVLPEYVADETHGVPFVNGWTFFCGRSVFWFGLPRTP